MDKKVTKQKNQATVVMTFDKNEWEAANENAYKKNASKYKIAGFRAGKAPRKMIEQQYGAGIFVEDAIQDLFADNFGDELKLIDYPHLDFEFTKDGGIKLTATCDIEPEVTLGQYKGLEIKKTEVKVGAKDVDAYLTRLQQTRAKQVAADKDHALANGEIAVIDFKGSVNGNYFDGGTAQNYELEIGSHSFIDNFEDQLVGMKMGEARDVNVTFPQDYHVENLKNAKAKFEVKLNNIMIKELPALDDQFAKEVSEFDNLKAFKDDILKKLTEQATKQAEYADEEKLFEKIMDNAKVEIPDKMIHDYAHSMIHDMEHQLAAYGANMEMYAQSMGTTVEKIHDEQHKLAAKQVKMRLVMDAIVEKEHLSDKDRQKQFDKLTIFLKKENKIC
ncbi:MAG: trigger factor [Eubacteriales bacterium]|nr:trigger factor [Eubacteriales bacterium]